MRRREPNHSRRLLVRALLALTVWLAGVVAVTLWKNPYFWLGPQERFERAQRLVEAGRPREALRELEAAIRKAPDHAGFRVYAGFRQLDEGDPGAAEASFRTALHLDPQNAEARLGLAQALRTLGREENATRELNELDADTLSAAQLRRRSQLYGLMKAPGPALEDLFRILETDQSDPDVLRDALTHARTLQDWPRVVLLADWMEATPVGDADRRWIAEARAQAAMALGRRAAAYESYGRTGNEAHLEQRAGLAWDLRRFDEAAALYADLAQRHPADARFLRMQAFALLSAGRGPEADVLFRRLVHQGAADEAVRRTYAWRLNVQRRYAEAWSTIEPLPRPAADPALLELQARTAVWAGRAREAQHLLESLLQARPDDAGLWLDLANVSQAAGDGARAAGALEAYVRLQSHDAAARQRLAQMLAAAGSLDAALAHYRRLVHDDPADWRAARAAGLLQETRGDLDAAKRSYEAAVAAAPDPEPDLLLRLARLNGWTGQPRAAVAYYEKYLARAGDLPSRRRAQAERALRLLDDGRAAESLAALEALAREAPLDPDALLTAARSAEGALRPDLAVRYLEALAAGRTLTLQEETWLAGAYRASGRREDARRAYERLAASPAAAAEVIEALGDLRYDSGDFAGAIDAFERLGALRDVRLKTARAAARAGRLDLAARQYRSHTAAHPEDAAGRLEFARFLSAAGRPEEALAHYRAAVDRSGAEGIRLEIARAHLAAGGFAAAEGWARQAAAAGEDLDASFLALAQALHIQGQHAAADAALATVRVSGPAGAAAHAWRGHIAAARNRHLSAFRALERAIDGGADGGERLALSMAAAARWRGDHRRARAAVERAAAAGAEPALVDAARRELGAVTAPRLSAPAWVHGDSNGLQLVQAGGGIAVSLPRDLGELGLDIASGTLEAPGFHAHGGAALLSLARVFPVPELELDGRLGLHRFGGDSRLSWAGTATWHVGDDLRVGFTGARQPVLPLFGPAPLRQFNRVRDLAALGPAFLTDIVRAFAELPAAADGAVRIEAGAGWLQDGNRQRHVYAHYQVPVASGLRRWTALRPNAYFETFDAERPAYFSPGRHLTLGTMLHTIRQYGAWDLELEMNPQMLRTDGTTGFGGHGLVNVRVRGRRATAEVGTFLFFDGLDDYLQWRIGARVSVPVGR